MKKKSIFTVSLIMSLFASLLFFTNCEKEEIITNAEIDSESAKGSRLKAVVSEGTFIITNRNSGRALDVNTSTRNVVQYSYWGGDNQKWVLTNVGSGYYRVSPVWNTAQGLDVASQSTADGANIQTYSYWGGNNQQWQFVDVGNGYYRIVNRNSGKALDVAQSSTINGGNIIQWSYWGGNNQQWSLSPVSGGSYNGQISWVLTSTGVPQDIVNRITSAMNAAVARYNKWGNWSPRTLTVQYNTGVPTADGNINGNIRFGSNTAYMTECTAMHEIAHTYGVGTSSRWGSPLIQNGRFVGANASAKVREFDGASAVISTGGGHFWPYGLNYNSEWSTANGDRHAQIMWAMMLDGLYIGY